MTIIEVKNDELLGRTNDGVIAVKFYAMQKQIDDLQKEIEELQQRIKTYEDPEDLTLMFMYCNEKAKDKIKELQNRIKKAIEYIENNTYSSVATMKTILHLQNDELYDLLEILKGEYSL